jgi:hypothetical protein
VAIDLGVASLALAVGFGGWRLATAGGAGASYTPAHNSASAFAASPPAAVPLPPPATGPVAAPPGSGAVSAVAAVDGFLAAEAAGDHHASYAFLSAGDRERYRTPAQWTEAQGTKPSIAGYAIAGDATAASPTAAAVTVRVDYAPEIDVVRGIVPAHADAVYAAVEEEGRWRVSVRDTTARAEWPPDGTAADAVHEWAAARQACRAAPQFSPLVGVPALAGALCHSQGSIAVGAPAPADATTGAALVAAFGDSAAAARVVPLAAPVGLRVLVAPDGDGWLVVGVLAPSG